jgi:phosphoribosylaminoimidazolecarboxamide formyltransferase/IMP cyclohydrolase
VRLVRVKIKGGKEMGIDTKGKKVALISVFNKAGIEEFAKALVDMGWLILSSGGTAKTLTKAGIPVTDVAELVGGGAILGHRIVTLSREVHAGLLADLKKPEDLAELEKLGIPVIRLVCCDFYPMKDIIAKSDATIESVVEMTDIGGPTMVRSAAKGGRIVICDAADRQWVLDELKANDGNLTPEHLQWMRAKAEITVANYCLNSARFHGQGKLDGIIGQEKAACKYGENPYMTPAAFFTTGSDDPLAIDKFQLVQGTDPSFINYTDIDRLLQTITHIAAGFDLNFGKVPKIAVGVKHGNPCGAAVGNDPELVIENMVMGDHLAIFGGIVMVNFKLTPELVQILLTTNLPDGERLLLDGVIAPAISEEAIALLKRKQDKCRILINPALANLTKDSLDQAVRIRPVRGGFLKQPNYTYILNLKDSQLVITKGKTLKTRHEEWAPSEEDNEDLILAWAIGCTSNSNTSTISYQGQLLGNGVGQQSRVASCQVAIFRAKAADHITRSSIVYTDSFFPQPDGPEELVKAGVHLVFASSGSVKDEDVRNYCREHNLTLIQLPDKVCRGFFGH